MNISEMTELAMSISKKYDIKNKQEGKKTRKLEQYMSGMVGDVGDLQKLIMAKHNYRHINDTQEKIEHELSDILRSLLIIAQKSNINLEQSFIENMKLLEKKL